MKNLYQDIGTQLEAAGHNAPPKGTKKFNGKNTKPVDYENTELVPGFGRVPKGWAQKNGYAKAEPVKEETLTEANAGVDTINMTVPLFIRCLEWAKEEAKDDVQIHKFVEKVISKGGTLNTDDYESFLNEETMNEQSCRTDTECSH